MIGSRGGGACDVDGLELAQAINELKMGGLMSLGPAVRSIPKAEGLGCSRFFFPLIAIVTLCFSLLKLLHLGQLASICPTCLHAKHLMGDLHALLK